LCRGVGEKVNPFGTSLAIGESHNTSVLDESGQMVRLIISSLHRHASNANANTLLFYHLEGIPLIQVNNFSIHGDFAVCLGKAVF
jgi:hypothetical protein